MVRRFERLGRSARLRGPSTAFVAKGATNFAQDDEWFEGSRRGTVFNLKDESVEGQSKRRLWLPGPVGGAGGDFEVVVIGELEAERVDAGVRIFGLEA
jgi:hypothetical protein